METEASSTDEKTPASGKRAVDGSFDTCFVSLTHSNPWFVVHLKRYHPIALVQVSRGKTNLTEGIKVSVANKGKYMNCPPIQKDLLYVSVACDRDGDHYIWGNAVMVQSDGKGLSLCEVQVYAETYGNIALNHFTRDAKLSRKSGKEKSLTTDGILKGGKCFSRTDKDSFWWLKFGSKVRVAMVFLMHSEDSFITKSGIEIKVGSGSNYEMYEVCAEEAGYNSAARYFPCKRTLLGSRVFMRMKNRKEAMSLCEVEIFQTKIINLAARRPTRDAFGSGKESKDQPELGCDQKIDKTFISIGSSKGPWWSVDLLASVEIHLIRIITDVIYKEEDRSRLSILVDSSEPKLNAQRPPGKKTKWLAEHIHERVLAIALIPPTEGRVVSLWLRGKQRELRFSEVEVYNGALLDVDECKMPGFCLPNFKCIKSTRKPTCVCPEGFIIEEGENGTAKKCVDFNECEYRCGPNGKCYNYPGSYSCTCYDGFELDKDSLSCTDVDECSEEKYYCEDTARCVNTPGSYRCECKPAYTRNAEGECEERCMEDCPRHSECVKGTCRCLPGYELLEPLNLCFEESLMREREQALMSGVTDHSPVPFLVAGLLGLLVVGPLEFFVLGWASGNLCSFVLA